MLYECFLSAVCVVQVLCETPLREMSFLSALCQGCVSEVIEVLVFCEKYVLPEGEWRSVMLSSDAKNDCN